LILAVATPAAKAAQEATRTIPIVFIGVSEPVAQGILMSLARPGGNITGFTNLEPTFGEKLLELLKEIAPTVNHAGVIFNPNTAPFAPSFARSAEAASAKKEVKMDTMIVRTPAEIENAILKIASEPGGGLIFPPDTYTGNHSKLIVELATRHSLPAIYGLKYFAMDGGLAFYGVDVAEQFRRAAGYVDRIMKGEKPAELPAQQPTKYELFINLKAAQAIGLTVAPQLLGRADEVIE
jgi:putative tryptophan/tyrosine transport system substrate-binding protein